jgi:hypothetical protein
VAGAAGAAGLLALALLLAEVASGVATPVLACSVTATPSGFWIPVTADPYTIAERTHDADVVLVGEVVFPESSRNRASVTMRVEQYVKGTGPDSVIVTGFGDGPDCHMPVWAGDRWLIFARGRADELLTVGTYFDEPVAAPNAENIAGARAAAGQVPIFPAAGRLATPPTAACWPAAALLLAALAGLTLARRRLGRR